MSRPLSPLSYGPPHAMIRKARECSLLLAGLPTSAGRLAARCHRGRPGHPTHGLRKPPDDLCL
jgi:hypothetical protein